MAEDIFGPNGDIIQGKSVHGQPGATHEGMDDVPPEITARCKLVTMLVDVVTVNDVKFFQPTC